jgi:integrase
VEAAECYRILGKEDASLLEAVHHYAAYLAQAKQSAPIGQLFEKFLAAKRQDGLSSKYLADLRSKLGRFVAAFSDTLACNLTAPTLEAWLRGLTMGSVSRESYRRNISVMLEFGRRRGALRVNPAADIKITRRPEGEVTILTSEDVARLLECCPSDLRPYVAICAFAGLRPSEAASLDWSNIHLDTLQIEVKARHSKTRRHRLVPMQPNLVAWLQPHKGESGPIGYSRRKFRDAYKAAGMEHWKTDVLRHSYGTFRLPILKSADALALEMGNSPAVIFRHYRRPMTETDAQRYFDLFPAKPALQSEAAKPVNEDGDPPDANASPKLLAA